MNFLNKNIAKIYSKYAGISKKKREKDVEQQAQSFLLFKEKEKQIIKDTEKYNRAAELYFQRKEKDLYIRNKPFELEKPNLIIQNRFALLIHALNISRADIVLDFGAGTCWTSALLNKMGAKTISLDVSKTALKIGNEEVFKFDKRQKMELNPAFVVYNGHNFPFSDDSIDRILCFDAFHHIPNQQEILNEMYRVLRDGGKAGFSEPGVGHSLSPDSITESETYGVLENDIYLDDFKQKADMAGFTEFLLNPYLIPNSVTLTLNEYSISEKKDGSYIERILSSINHPPIIILEKRKEKIDSRHPGSLKAKIEIIDGILEIRAGEVMALTVKVKNIGDTLWISTPQNAPGTVAVGIHLIDGTEKIDFARGYITDDLPPGDEDTIRLSFVAPNKKGNYKLKLNMVDEQICWFSDKGSETPELEIEVI